MRIVFWWEDRRESNHLEELGKIIIKRIFKKLDGSADEINLAQNQDRLRALAKAVIKSFYLHNMQETYRLAEDMLASEEGIYSSYTAYKLSNRIMLEHSITKETQLICKTRNTAYPVHSGCHIRVGTHL